MCIRDREAVAAVAEASPADETASNAAPVLNGADTAWILTATALVLVMTIPGLSLFYAGLVGRKNVLSVLMHCFMITAIMSILWLVCGYSIALGESSPYWGGLGEIFAKNLTADGMSDAGLPDYMVSVSYTHLRSPRDS